MLKFKKNHFKNSNYIRIKEKIIIIIKIICFKIREMEDKITTVIILNIINL